MSFLERFQTLIILIAVALGLLLGQFIFFQENAEMFVLPFLLFMLYGLFLTIPLHHLKDAFKNIKFLGANTIINFVWSPLLAWGLGAVFLSEHPLLWIGFIMLMVTPCTDWYLIFTSIAKGNLSLSTSVLPINLVLQVLLLPVYLFIFAGTIESIPLSTIVESIVLVLVIPFIFAHLTRYLFQKKATFLNKKLIPFFSFSQIIFLSLAIVAMFASQGNYLVQNFEIIYIFILPILIFFIINFIVAQTVGKVLNFSYEDTVSLNLTITARNSPVSLAIAITAFPDQPIIALVLVIGPLIELPILAVITKVLLSIRRKRIV